jgi:hypothetical protein
MESVAVHVDLRISQYWESSKGLVGYFGIDYLGFVCQWNISLSVSDIRILDVNTSEVFASVLMVHFYWQEFHGFEAAFITK